MARRVENDCVGPCPQGCMGSSCMYRNVVYFSCDECGLDLEPDELYDYDCMELCKDCLLEKVPKIEY